MHPSDFFGLKFHYLTKRKNSWCKREHDESEFILNGSTCVTVVVSLASPLKELAKIEKAQWECGHPL